MSLSADTYILRGVAAGAFSADGCDDVAIGNGEISINEPIVVNRALDGCSGALS